MKLTQWIIAALLTAAATGAFAQALPTTPAPAGDLEVSKEELQSFVAISTDLRAQQQDMQAKMVAIIEDSDLGRQKYTEMAQSLQSGQKSMEDFPEAELEEFKSLNGELQPLQMESQQNAVKLIQENDMEIQRFQLIAKALQSDKELQERYMALVQNQ